MSFSIVQHNLPGPTTGSPITSTFSVGVTTGNLLVSSVHSSIDSATISVSDNINGSWTRACTTTATGWGTQEIWYFPNSSSGSITVSATMASNTSGDLGIVEVSGVATASPLDVAAGTTGFGGATPAVSITTTVGGDFIFGGMRIPNASGSAGASFTGIDAVSGIAIDEWTTQLSSGSISVAFANASSGGGAWAVCGAAFKASGGGGGGTGPIARNLFLNQSINRASTF